MSRAALPALAALCLIACGDADAPEPIPTSTSDTAAPEDSGGGVLTDAADTAAPPSETTSDEPACVPDCAGKSCGPDGCGGVCGTCTDLCTGERGGDELCAGGACVSSCGALAITPVYEGSVPYDSVTAYLHPDTACEALLGGQPALGQATSQTAASVDETLAISAVTNGTWAVAVLAKSEVSGPAAAGCASGVVVDGATVALDVPLVEGPVAFEGVYVVDSQFDMTGSVPPSVEGLVSALAEMTDDDDLFDDDPLDDQYGQDPAAFLLDLVYRQFCCWEATGPDPSWDSCQDQETTHPVGDLSALYLQDFTVWPGAQPVTTGLCGALANGVDPLLQAIVLEVLDAQAPGVATLLANIPVDLKAAIEDLRIRSELAVQSAGALTDAPFVHTLVSVEVGLHDLDGQLHEVDIPLGEVGLTALEQTGTVVVDGKQLLIPPHAFQLELGKLLLHIYQQGLIPLLGWSSTQDMLASWIDCPALGVKLEDTIPDLGFLDEDDYADFCVKGLEEAADFLEETIASTVEATAVITIQGTATAADVNPGGTVLSFEAGVWDATWAEGEATGAFAGTFTGVRK